MADIIQKSFNSSRREIKYLNRDFRSLMKAVDKKKQHGTLGSGMVSMG